MRISDWSSDVCSSDLLNDDEVVARDDGGFWLKLGRAVLTAAGELQSVFANVSVRPSEDGDGLVRVTITTSSPDIGIAFTDSAFPTGFEQLSSMSKRSEEHTSELQSLMRIPYDVFCLIKNS